MHEHPPPPILRRVALHNTEESVRDKNGRLIFWGLDLDHLALSLNISVTLYSPSVVMSKIIQMQLQTENIDPINKNILTDW